MLDYDRMEKILKDHFETVTPEEFRANLERVAPELFEAPKEGKGRPWAEPPRLADAIFMKYDFNTIGYRIRAIRHREFLTLTKVAEASNGMFTKEKLEEIEESTDQCSPLTLTQLRAIAYLLNTTVGELMDVDFDELMIAGRPAMS
jgi:hypothetical protein